MAFNLAFDVNAMEIKFPSTAGADYIGIILDFLYARC